MAYKLERNLHSISDHMLSYRVCFKAGFDVLVHAYDCIDHFIMVDGSFSQYINFIWQNGRIICHIPADRILSIMLVGFLNHDMDDVIFADGKLL